MGLAGPETFCHRIGNLGLEAAAAAGAGPRQAELGGAWIAGAAGHHEQAAAPIFAGNRIQWRPGGRASIGGRQGQGCPTGQGGQLGVSNAQVDSLQLTHPSQGRVLD